ncbi:DUF551 domain-containing protein [Phytobacter diazotrophicus]|uniref:DUF551 domain-containing protein n=1 Tax=Phytobacter diazotrophicus TaxID=395631 RepID=UPI002FF382D5
MKDETLLPDERTAFEKFMDDYFGNSVDRRRVKNGDGEYMTWDMQVAWIVWKKRAALQSGNSGQPVTVHDGYVLVPVEPTDLMVEAMYRHPLSMRGALKAAISAAPKAPDGWIPVSERMPNKHEDVLVFETLNKDKLVASHKGDGHFYWNLNEEGREEYIDVSHWQPLPAPPVQ